jgi:hypothetical protein
MFVDLGEDRMTLRSLPAEQAALDLPVIEVQHKVSPSLLIISVSSKEGEDNVCKNITDTTNHTFFFATSRQWECTLIFPLSVHWTWQERRARSRNLQRAFHADRTPIVCPARLRT